LAVIKLEEKTKQNNSNVVKTGWKYCLDSTIFQSSKTGVLEMRFSDSVSGTVTKN